MRRLTVMEREKSQRMSRLAGILVQHSIWAAERGRFECCTCDLCIRAERELEEADRDAP